VRQPTIEIGKTTAKWILQMIDAEEEMIIPKEHILKTELIIRGSSLRNRI
jgi:DNA-binding LacI/PurR family transcriptional regulator